MLPSGQPRAWGPWGGRLVLIEAERNQVHFSSVLPRTQDQLRLATLPAVPERLKGKDLPFVMTLSSSPAQPRHQ